MQFLAYVTEILGERLTGTADTWESLLRKHLLVPLGISQDVEFGNAGNTSRFVKPYYYFKGALQEGDIEILQLNGVFGPAGSICMSADAMVRWMQFLLGNGKYEGVQIVESEDIENTWRSRIDNYGLGWRVGSHRGAYQ
jgi:CubicO group peptidase (beta-lactamase class C family)